MYNILEEDSDAVILNGDGYGFFCEKSAIKEIAEEIHQQYEEGRCLLCDTMMFHAVPEPETTTEKQHEELHEPNEELLQVAERTITAFRAGIERVVVWKTNNNWRMEPMLLVKDGDSARFESQARQILKQDANAIMATLNGDTNRPLAWGAVQEVALWLHICYAMGVTSLSLICQAFAGSERDSKTVSPLKGVHRLMTDSSNTISQTERRRQYENYSKRIQEPRRVLSG